MNKIKYTFSNIDEYHAACPTDVQKRLDQLRLAILQAAPEAAETISYNMPAFRSKKTLVYYAAHKEHIGFYPTPGPIKQFAKELQPFKTSKGAVQFPLNKALPVSLIKKMVHFRLAEVTDGSRSPKKLKPTMQAVHKDILLYNNRQNETDRTICDLLLSEICHSLPDAENKVWHGHPVWFIEGNPIVGYSKEKRGMRLMFWSGLGFDEEGLDVRGKKFKDASTFYTSPTDIHVPDLKRWLKKSRNIQWDYKNLVKRKGILERLR